MSFLDNILDTIKNNSNDFSQGIISTGKNKSTGGHDHRTNKGDDRTPSQKKGDKNRRKD
jgi:hypothetical protein